MIRYDIENADCSFCADWQQDSIYDTRGIWIYDDAAYISSLNSSLHDHCSPTAATNMVMYWKYGRGFFSGNSTSQSTVFNWFYSQMGTNYGQTGTNWTNIEYPIASYFASYSGASSASVGTVYAVTYSNIKAKCDSNIPLQLEVIHYVNSSTNHSINVWGYNTMSSGNYLYITHNLNSSNYVSFSLMNYSAYSYGQFVYTNAS